MAELLFISIALSSYSLNDGLYSIQELSFINRDMLVGIKSKARD
ncbi:MAG: hypothetical protein PHO67_06970 [Candidatus Omnitrophica bacterium]|nr:hypothetical protein [Candidatus Omnitrophota bacterium]